MQQVAQQEIAWHTYKLDQGNSERFISVLNINAYELIKLIETALIKGFVDKDEYRLFAKPIISSIGDYGINFAIDIRLYLIEER